MPERTLRNLDAIGPDRGRAIVRLVDAAVPTAPSRSRVEVAQTGLQSGLIIVGHSPGLEKIPFLHLVEISPGRHLLALERGNDFRTLELAVGDALQETDPKDENEVALLTDLLGHIQRLRKSFRVSMAEILVVRLAWVMLAAL
ncbi:MAG: hypothetical protein ACKV19_23040 [Verrucomicrobiales bacterium]